MKKTVGIDIGTTNCCIASHDGRQAEVIETAEGLRVMPSVVAFSDRGERLVGRPALTQSHSNSDFSFFRIKRLMGVEWKDGEDYGSDTVRGPDGYVWFKGPDRLYSPAELTGMLLKTLLDAAEHKLEARPERAVITVPANASTPAKRATMEAATKFAGLKQVHLLHEPTAAAIAYGVTRKKFSRIAVYDLGGGTFDIALMDVGRDYEKTIETNGDSHLGGADFDQRIMDHVLKNWREKVGKDLMLLPEAMRRVRDASEQAKIALSSREDAQLLVRFAVTNAEGHHHLMEKLTKSEFEELVKELIDQTLEICQRALTSGGRTKEDVDEVLLVGGMTRVPAIKAAVTNFFGKPSKSTLNPDEVVALGAATHAAVLDNLMRFTLDDRTSQSFGVKAAGNAFARIIPKGSVYPVRETAPVTTHVDNQEVCTIHVYEGEDHRADQNLRLAHVHVPVEPAPAGEATIEVTFELDANALLSVTGRMPNGDIFPIHLGAADERL